uniref:Aminopeptidase NAALADL1 n=1 Tax=Halisarca dujardinii TaxID=2583056 RepID=A0A6C0PMX7_HALDU|nr:N-acetylated-alpha-linked acidic dipeptidase [Halisarca dujardinii]QIZ30868.1 N-acetylated-alpha-linked acidic dipeptidase [Halisarca dujardinii]
MAKEDYSPLEAEESSPKVKSAVRIGKDSKLFKIIRNVGILIVFALAGLTAGVLIGYLAFSGAKTPSCSEPQVAPNNIPKEWGALVSENGKLVPAGDQGVLQMDATRIENNLKMLTVEPHIAGSKTNNDLAKTIAASWRELKLDKVEEIQYSVLLQYPNDTNPNRFQIRLTNHSVVFDAPTAQLEPPVTDDEKKEGVARPFNAYSGVGSAEGPLVYVNYARREDFQNLTDMGVNVSQCICLARYGQIFRGSKALVAQQNGCLGLVIYSDPIDYGPKKGFPAYPNGWSLPETGLQRGTVMLMDGDPLTPLHPSIPDVYRRSLDEALADHSVPSIPVTPLSSSDAIHFLSIMSTGKEAPEDWRGGLNLTYYLGPGFNSENQNSSAYMEVNNYYETKPIVNVVGTIYGSQEPDHPVLLGNHRDAWTFGGADPNSGTATMLEVVRSLSLLRETGWRPGRTMMFCSWDAEEYGLVGSVEFVEDRSKQLLLNAVAYLNVDVAVGGIDHLRVKASPMLIPAFYQATKEVTSPNDPSLTVYEEWQLETGAPGEPDVGGLGSGSDYTGFFQVLGITSGDLSYTSTFNATDFFAGYPVYHSIHDTFQWIKTSLEPHFAHHLALGKVWLRTALNISTTPVLPFGVVEYGEHLLMLVQDLNSTHNQTLGRENITLDFLFTSVESFQASAKMLQDAVDYVKEKDLNMTENLKKWRVLNSKLVGVERSFLVPEGLPGRPFFKHVVYAPGKYNSYSSAAFPGITDSIVEENWRVVREQVTVAALNVRAAANVMTDSLQTAIYDNYSS